MVHCFVLYERILLKRMTWYIGLFFMKDYCWWRWLGTLVCTLWTNIVNEDELVHWFVLSERKFVCEDNFAHWFIFSERILFVRITVYTGLYFMNAYCLWGWLGTLVFNLWTNIVNEDNLVHWFVLSERILFVRITLYTGLYFMNEYC